MEEVERHFDDTWFAWIGATSDDAVFYYRIHSPVILIEFDTSRRSRWTAPASRVAGTSRR